MNDVTRIGALSRAEAEGFDYQAEADKTCSIEWNPQYVNYANFHRNLQQFVDLCGVLNVYKKLLFRGKTPADVGLPMPEHVDSLAGYGGAFPTSEIDLVHGILGSATEVGELAEILLDMLDGKAADRVNAIEESGDIRWYLNRVLRWADCSDLECEMTNIDKLHGRHGSTFDVFRDAHRDLARERARLEAAVDRNIADETPPTLPLGPHGDETEDDGFNTVHPSFERRPIGDVPGMDC